MYVVVLFEEVRAHVAMDAWRQRGCLALGEEVQEIVQMRKAWR
jgi:hypothetical protein